MWARIINTILGIWMLIAPAVWGYAKPAANNAFIFGAIIATVAIIAMAESVRNTRWLNLVFGVWLVLAPWILGFETEAKINDTLVGISVSALSLIKGQIKEQMGGGWTAIFKNP
jgi:hypothetical protein